MPPRYTDQRFGELSATRSHGVPRPLSLASKRQRASIGVGESARSQMSTSRGRSSPRLVIVSTAVAVHRQSKMKLAAQGSGRRLKSRSAIRLRSSPPRTLLHRRHELDTRAVRRRAHGRAAGSRGRRQVRLALNLLVCRLHLLMQRLRCCEGADDCAATCARSPTIKRSISRLSDAC